MPRVFILLFLAGCAATTPPKSDPVPAPTDDTCQGAQYERLIGQDATALERVLILRQVRVIRRGDVVTQDFVPQRLNFNINVANRIASITCG